MVKRFIICCDGTWNSSDSGSEGIPSNVALLSRMIGRQGRRGADKPDAGAIIEQVVYYQTGVGTGPSTGMVAKLEQKFEGMTGSGLEEHVLQAYHFISTNYQVGDEVLLFGFSRGAYTARAVGGLLTQMGVLKPVDLKHFNALYRCFKEQSDKLSYIPYVAKNEDASASASSEKNVAPSVERSEVEKMSEKSEVFEQEPLSEEELEEERRKFERWTTTVPPEVKKPGTVASFVGWGTGKVEDQIILENKPIKIDVEVIGVWDTVGALGMPVSMFSTFFGINKGKDFADTKLNRHVKRAYQALALDEHRGAFTPSLWYIEDNSEDDLSLEVDLRQCWFPGFHADIGGGGNTDPEFVKDKKAHQIDQISLAWMCDQIDGLVTFHKHVAYAFLPEAHNAIDWKWTARGQKDAMTQMYALNTGGGSQYRSPGIYQLPHTEEEVERSAKKEAPGFFSKVFGGHKQPEKPVGVVIPPRRFTRERIHPSVQLLMDATENAPDDQHARKYLPAALGKSPIKRYNGYGDYIPGLAVIKQPEWIRYERKTPGGGAIWRRAEIAHKPGVLGGWWEGEVQSSPKIILDEHVIMDTKDEASNNFEARLLTKDVKKRLRAQNSELIKKIQDSWEAKKHSNINREIRVAHHCHEDWWFGTEAVHKEVHRHVGKELT